MGSMATCTAFIILCLLLAGTLPPTAVWLGVCVGLLSFSAVVE